MNGELESRFRTATRSELTLFCLGSGQFDESSLHTLLRVVRDQTLVAWRRRFAVIQLFLKFALNTSLKAIIEDWRCTEWIDPTTVKLPLTIGPCPLYGRTPGNIIVFEP